MLRYGRYVKTDAEINNERVGELLWNSNELFFHRGPHKMLILGQVRHLQPDGADVVKRMEIIRVLCD
jgi:hypothetical protein